MPLLQVRNFPSDLYDALRETARADNRSLAQETIVILREHVEGRGQGEVSSLTGKVQMQGNRLRRQRVLERIDELHREHPVQLTNGFDPVVAVREWRDRDRLSRVEGA
jgi:plasmid stability protein